MSIVNIITEEMARQNKGLKQCRKCFFEVTSTAEKCPNCRTPFKKKKGPVVVVCLIILIIGGVFAAISTNSSNGWYRGGTLHQGTVRDWNNASKRNKIATAADFALSSQYVSAKVKNSGKMDTLKPYAQELATCIEETSARQGYKTMRISEIGASCIILLNW